MAGLFPLRLHAQPAQGQISYEGEKVGFVDLVVRPGINAEALHPLILRTEGESYSQESVQNSIAALKQAGRFSKVDVVAPEAAGLRVAFVAQPAFYVGMIYFPGALKELNYSRLLCREQHPLERRRCTLLLTLDIDRGVALLRLVFRPHLVLAYRSTPVVAVVHRSVLVSTSSSP